MLEQLREKLLSLDWDLRGVQFSKALHNLHWYPGTFIPQIPAYLIEALSRKDDLILDPFCGVGTTLLESTRLGRSCVGSDTNELAVLISKAKTTTYDEASLQGFCSLFVKTLDAHMAELEFQSHEYDSFVLHAENCLTSVNFEELRFWFHPKTLNELSHILIQIKMTDPRYIDLLTVIFSSILKRCSSQKGHWGYISDNMIPKNLLYEDARRHFTLTLNRFVKAYSMFQRWKSTRQSEGLTRKITTETYVRSALDPASYADSLFDVVITSPPYINVTDYAGSQRLSYLWLGLDYATSREWEIGARWKRGRLDATSSYLNDVETSVSNVRKWLKSDGYLCMVIGQPSSEYSVGVVDRIKQGIPKLGFKTIVDDISRSPSNQRLKSRSGVSARELVLVYRKI